MPWATDIKNRKCTLAECDDNDDDDDENMHTHTYTQAHTDLKMVSQSPPHIIGYYLAKACNLAKGVSSSNQLDSLLLGGRERSGIAAHKTC